MQWAPTRQVFLKNVRGGGGVVVVVGPELGIGSRLNSVGGVLRSSVAVLN